MFPLRDDNPTRITPVVTILLILINTAVFVWQWSTGLQAHVVQYGLIPIELLQNPNINYGGKLGLPGNIDLYNHDPAWVTLFSAMFMHGGWMHLIGNMWFLWIFGNNVEDSMGHFKYLVFYLVAGLAAAGAQILAGPDSPIPMVGASGAIGGVLGAYLVLFPGARVTTLITAFIITVIEIPAVVVLGMWFVLQFVNGLGVLGKDVGGVAYAAHVGGFACGMLLGRILGQVTPPRHEYRPRQDFMDWR